MNMRLKKRFILRQVILESVQTYEIIESYPGDKYLPSYLVWGKHGEIVFHVLFAVDVPNDHVRVVTAYHSNPGEWDDELKRRRM